MKKLILFLAVTGIVFSSCNGKYTIAKRKYNKGFYVSRSSGNDAKTSIASSNKTAKINHTESIQQEIVVASKNEVLKTESTINEPILTKSFVSIEKNNHKAITKTNEIASTDSKPVLDTKNTKLLEITKKVIVNSKKSDSDTNVILLVILCLFWWFNLIAVYLHDGKKVTTNFLVTLLLDIIFIGIIFSILVVLDIIDLR